MIFCFRCLLGFWRRRLGMIFIALKAILLSGQFFIQPFISFVVSAAALVGSMNKFLLQNTTLPYASWILLDTSWRFCPPHLMLGDSSLTITLCSGVVVTLLCSEDHSLCFGLLADYQWPLAFSFFSSQLWSVDLIHYIWRNFLLCKTCPESSHFRL